MSVTSLSPQSSRKFLIKRKQWMKDQGTTRVCESKLYKGENNSRASLKSNVTLGETETRFYFTEPDLLLHHIHVEPSYRRSKNPKNAAIAEALYKDVVDQSFDKGFKGRVTLLARDKYVPSAKAHTRHGFELVNSSETKKMMALLAEEEILKQAVPSDDNKLKLTTIRKRFFDFFGWMYLPDQAIERYVKKDRTTYEESTLSEVSP
jgi:hypothetical protein